MRSLNPVYQFYHRLAFLFVRLFSKTKISYAQNKEDNIIDILTGQKKNGTYIDIGANDPDIISNTKLFYKRGWRGINVEPDIDGYNRFLSRRPLDVNLNDAVGEGEGHYYECEYSVGNTTDENVAKDRSFKSSRTIRLKPLREIFAENNLTYVDFISIDVEGSEMQVLMSNDWNKYKAGVLCIERQGFDEFLKKYGYKKVLYDGCNTYYKLTK